MNITKMAWRNVWRNKRRSLVSIAAMSFALWVLLLYSGLIMGYLQGMTGDLIEGGVGDMQVMHSEYKKRPSIYSFVEDTESLMKTLEKSGYRVSAQLLGGGLAAAGEYSSGVSLYGIEPIRYLRTSNVHEKLAKGKWIDSNDLSGVVIGKHLARTLEVSVGDELLLLSQATDGSMANDLYTVKGILATVGDAVDRTGIYMNASTFREFMVFPSGSHQLVIRLPVGVEQQAGREAVAALLSSHDKVLTWQELYPTIATMIQSTEGVVYILYFIFYVAIGILILNSMLMAVFERVKEFGVLKAIGLEPFKVLLLIALEAAIQIVMAVIVGTIVALPAMAYLSIYGINMGQMGGMNVAGMSMAQIWYGIYTLESSMVPVIMLIFMAGTATIYPALKAAWIKPVTAMRHQ